MKLLFLTLLFFCFVFADELPKTDDIFINPMLKRIELKYLDENLSERKIVFNEYANDKSLAARYETFMSNLIDDLYILTVPYRIIGAFTNTVSSPQDDYSPTKSKVDSLFRSGW